MPYSINFQLADDYIAHTNSVVYSLSDPFIQRRYIGFVTISAVTVYELCIRDILTEFADRKHKVFGTVITNIYGRLNGRIGLRDLKETHVRRFGEKYYRRFNNRLEAAEKAGTVASGRSIKASYGNIVTWRHEFVHEGRVPGNATYEEAVRAYYDGKEVIRILSRCMNR